VLREKPLLELSALALCLACQGAPKAQRQRALPAPSAARISAPAPAGLFECVGEVCSQAYPRLPDTGEWRCADTGGVVWCAGGEPAAGVVPGPADPGYRCGARFGKSASERVCIDRHPDYPAAGAAHYRCSFAQERGVTRVCKSEAAVPASSLSPQALPACWLDKDCGSGDCDRGTCRCSGDGECERGACRLGVCSEGS
jgi:hypothetical protein